MLIVGEVTYDLTNINDREELHKWVDQWVEENFEDLLMNGELDPELAQFHELISEEDRESLHGKWFNGNLEIKHWYEPITEYLKEMEVSYEELENGDIVIYVGGEEVVFTRNLEPEEEKGVRYEICKDGIIRRDVLEKYGFYYVKDYYLPKVA